VAGARWCPVRALRQDRPAHHEPRPYATFHGSSNQCAIHFPYPRSFAYSHHFILSCSLVPLLLRLSSPLSVQNRALSAIAQAESLKFKLLGGLAVRRACYGVMRYVMENGAKGVEVVISGKLRAARAKAMKFRDGYMVKSGDAVNHYIDFAVRHIQLKQGVLGIKVKIQLPHDPTGKNGVAVKPSDVVTILDPKEELPVTQPKQQGFVQNVETAAAPAVAAETQQ